MTTTRTATAASTTAAADRRKAAREALTFIPNDRPADRSKNGTRTPRSVRHKGLR